MPLSDQLVAFWTLDEASGTRNDSVGANHLTDVNTVTQAVGKIGNAAQFVRANSEHLSIADNPALSIGDADATLCAWLYLDSLGVVSGVLSKDTEVGADREYGLYVSGGNSLQWYIFGPVGGFQSLSSTFGALSAATWYFVVAWHDSSTDTIKMQINNATVDSRAVNASGVVDAAAPFRIGRQASGTYFNGRIDAVGVWKRVLTSDERTELWNGGAGIEYPFSPAQSQAPRSMHQYRQRRAQAWKKDGLLWRAA